MTSTALGKICIGAQAVWGRSRTLYAVRLNLLAPDPGHAALLHLVREIAGGWPPNACPLMLATEHVELVPALLRGPANSNIWVELDAPWRQQAPVAAAMREAQQHGRQLVLHQHGAPGAAATGFQAHLVTLDTAHTLQALRAARRGGTTTDPSSPVQAGSIYAQLASEALINHALDQQRAVGVVGWPVDEVLHARRHKTLHPARRAIRAVLQLLEQDAALERLEDALGQEPLLVVRFLVFANSAHVGAPRTLEALHEALLFVGEAALRTWLNDQLRGADDDSNLAPVRWEMVLCARLLQSLVQAGSQEALRREAYLCGLLAHIDGWLPESQGSALQRLPLPGRITSAILGQTGPYGAWLQVASALASGNPRLVTQLCQGYDLDRDHVNRCLLQALAKGQAP